MKETYIPQDINRFFEEFNRLSNSYTIEKVHQLINNPHAKATHQVKFQFNHLITIIMTSAFIISIATLFLWFTPKKSDINSIDKGSIETPATNT